MSNILEYKGYHGSIAFDAEDGLLIGYVIGIQDSLNFHGFTVDEVTRSFQDCIDGYLEMCAKFGRNPDKEYKGSFNIRISPELHRSADITAKKHGISLNQFVTEAIQLKLGVCKEDTPTIIYVEKSPFSASFSIHQPLASQHYKSPVPIPFSN